MRLREMKRNMKRRWEIDRKIRDKEKGEEYQSVYIGSLNIIAGRPDPLPSIDMLERLRGLQLPDTSYVPDEDEPSQDLIAVAYVRGATLFTAWLLSGYGDDIQPTHRELENLLVRLNSVRLDSIDPLDRVRSLSWRVSAELAFQRGDYAIALRKVADSIYPLYHWDEIHANPPELSDAQFAPWLSGVEILAKNCIEAIEHGGSADWPAVVGACDLLSRCFFNGVKYIEPRALDDSVETAHTFWIVKASWAQAQLTPDRLRNLLGQQDDESAVQRMETYFFVDGLWEKLPERAQRALVTADRTLMSSTSSRYALVANEIRIATEEILNEYLWKPLNAWAERQQDYPHAPFSGIRRAKEFLRMRGDDAPSLGDYANLVLMDVGTSRFLKDEFQTVKKDEEFIRQRLPKSLKRLLTVRNPGEHELGHDSERATIRDLYAESLGIGGKGVLPDLVRLLAKD